MTAPTAPPPGFKLEHLTADPALSYYVYQTPLEQSFSDDREYRLIRLPNQLEALIIRAKPDEAIKSSAALTVQVGDFADPKDLPGLAHFCEHLLFMGTEKYPKENEYSEYLSNNGGNSNAYTDMNHTNYHFTVNSEYFEGALDRFAQFFLAPLFNQDCTDRELKAVDSEHKKNLQRDVWRQNQLLRSLTDPDHPMCNFGTGDIKTLKEIPERKGIDVRAELLKFHQTYYSANLMRLAVFGRDSLDQLTEWVVTKFSGVVNKDRPYPHYDTLPWKPEHLQRVVRSEAAQTSRSLTLTFPLKDFKPQYYCNPGYFAACLVGHEGHGSLMLYLKQRGWITNLSAGCSYSDVFGFDFFNIDVQLSPEGLRHTEEIVAATFEYLRLLHDNPIPEDFFERMRHMSQIEFRYSSKPDGDKYVTHLSSEMRFPWLLPEHLLSGTNLLREYRPDEIRDLLSYLNPDNFFVFILAKGLNLVNPQVEEHYGVHYTVEPVSAKLLARLKAIDRPNPAFHLPLPNDFIPQNLAVDKLNPDGPKQIGAHLLRADGRSRLWHKKDDRFGLPRGSINVVIHSPLANVSPYHAVRLDLLLTLWFDAMNEELYSAGEAGIGVSGNTTPDGISLRIAGFNDKLPYTLEYVLTQLRDFTVASDRFELMKENLVRRYEQFEFSSALSHASGHMDYLTLVNLWRPEERLAAARVITIEDLTVFHREFLRRLCPEVLVFGNFTEEQALTVNTTAHAVLRAPGDPFTETEGATSRSIILPHGARLIRQDTHPNPKEQNAGIILACQIGMEQNFELRAHLKLASDMIFEPFFDQLRTKEALGYIVRSDVRTICSGLMFLDFVIQSEQSPVYLEARILTFLHNYVRQVEAMPAEKFEKHRDALVKEMSEPPRSIGQEAGQIFARIRDSTWEFDLRARDSANLQRLTQASLVAFLRKFLDPASQHFTKLSTHVFPAKHTMLPTSNPEYYHQTAEADGTTNGTAQPGSGTVARTTTSPGCCPYTLSFLGFHAYLVHHHTRVPPQDLIAALRATPVRDGEDVDAMKALVEPLVNKYYEVPALQEDKPKNPTETDGATTAMDTDQPDGASGSESDGEDETAAKPAAKKVPTGRAEGIAKVLADMVSEKVIGSFFDPQGILTTSPLIPLPAQDAPTDGADARASAIYETFSRLPYEPYVVPMADNNSLILDPQQFKSCLNLTSSVLPYLNFKPKY
ncbi:metalloprotease [Tieghemiomyces parasiticus]|uniref:Metalloprotease n=1 Tax=Tieghemiomyces parasiticus TaxID=78921 RepID=A0A9W8ABC3_9FUNG|nr:metalloprotease [Tieghemiomyces parasiticus]